MTHAIPTTRRRKQAGYTLLMAVFMVATLLIAAGAVAPNLLTQGRREKEAEMVWRGEQYERAIGLYMRHFNGKYPTRIEDLTKQTNGLRFLRQAYKDPMNNEDGSWRFIYVGPNGQLVGSLRQTSLLQTALSSQGILGLSSLTGGIPILQTPGATNNQQTGTGTPGQQTTTGTPTTTSTATTGNPLESQPQPLTGTVLGGNIIGVGSKIKKPSLRIYMGGDTYQTWEFIYNPTGQTALPGQAPPNPNNNPTAAPNGAPPNGADPNAPVVPPPQQSNPLQNQ